MRKGDFAMRMINNLRAKPAKLISDLRDMVNSSAERFGDKVLYRYLENKSEKTYSYNDLKSNVYRLGTMLLKLGLGGKRIAVIGDNHPMYTTAYLACVGCNSTIVPLDKELLPEQIVGFMQFAEIEAVFYTVGFNSRMRALLSDLPNIKYLFPISPDEGEVAENVISVDKLLSDGQAAMDAGDTAFADTVPDMERCCALLFTSGTTGTSKGVMLSQRNLTAAVNSSCQSMQYDDESTFVTVLPPHHTYQMTCGEFGVINIGGEAYLNDSIKRVMKNFATYKPNTLVLVPLFVETMHKRIWDEIRRQGVEKKVRSFMQISAAALSVGIDLRKKFFGRITDAFGGNLKSIVCGGAPINPEIIKDFYHFGITVLEGYGITECAPLVAVNHPGKVRFRSVGTPVHGCEVRIDYDEGQETGEILVKGDNIMLGYYKNPEATAAVFTDDGFFRTGDIGYMDEDGYIFITGRKKNVIILSNGKNVFPEELEEYLSKIPSISETVVIGRKKGIAENETAITAIVVPNMDCPALVGKKPNEVYSTVRADVLAINKKLPSFKHVSDVEIRYEPFEKNSSQKIKRYKIQ